MIIVLNKPYGVLSQFTPEVGSAWTTLADFGIPGDMYPIGRLDADSEGMLVLSDERHLVASLLEPEHAHPRTYWTQVEHNVSELDLANLEAGVVIQGRPTRPCKAKILHPAPVVVERNPPIRYRATVPTSWIELELTEGKNRQVRRMTAAVGHPTLRLMRVRIGRLALADLGLSVGTWCALTAAQRGLLLQRT